jgi:cytochrome c-type biogenesis protein CcmE
MKRKHRRLLFVLGGGVVIGLAAALVLFAFRDSLVFFVTPSDLAAKGRPGMTLRLGGLVERGSVQKTTENGVPHVRFEVGDGERTVWVDYSGVLPDLFREGQGVVVIGKLAADGHFAASEVLAKHDETYMPKDVVEALRKSGHWQPEAGPPPPAASWNTLGLDRKGGG